MNTFAYDGNDDSPEELSNKSINKLKPITIAPNPNNGTFTVNFEQNLERTIFIKLMNSSVHIVYEKTNAIDANSFELNLQNLANGIYYIMITDNDTIDIKEKLVIIKNE